jgi:hypothetical protein
MTIRPDFSNASTSANAAWRMRRMISAFEWWCCAPNVHPTVARHRGGHRGAIGALKAGGSGCVSLGQAAKQFEADAG